MKGFKGFDKDLKCRGYQYTVGDTERYSGTISLDGIDIKPDTFYSLVAGRFVEA